MYVSRLHITGASVPKSYFEENITVFWYPEMTILLVLKHGYNIEYLYPSLGGYILWNAFPPVWFC